MRHSAHLFLTVVDQVPLRWRGGTECRGGLESPQRFVFALVFARNIYITWIPWVVSSGPGCRGDEFFCSLFSNVSPADCVLAASCASLGFIPAQAGIGFLKILPFAVVQYSAKMAFNYTTFVTPTQGGVSALLSAHCSLIKNAPLAHFLFLFNNLGCGVSVFCPYFFATAGVLRIFFAV